MLAINWKSYIKLCRWGRRLPSCLSLYSLSLCRYILPICQPLLEWTTENFCSMSSVGSGWRHIYFLRTSCITQRRSSYCSPTVDPRVGVGLLLPVTSSSFSDELPGCVQFYQSSMSSLLSTEGFQKAVVEPTSETLKATGSAPVQVEAS